jgi:hypothetical protein
MAIFEVTDTEVVQRCAKCGNENHTPLSKLEVGVGRESRADPRIIPLPECPICHSTEFLIRSADGEPAHPTPGSFGHLHRMLIDHLHAQLVSAGNVNPAFRDQAIARPVSSADHKRWFPNGTKIDPALASPQETK